MHADSVETGHAASLARPGGNITGLALLQTEINRTGFEILISAVPASDRQPAGGADDARVKDLRNASTAGQYQEAETRCQSVGRSDYAVSESNRIRAQQWFAGRET